MNGRGPGRVVVVGQLFDGYEQVVVVVLWGLPPFPFPLPPLPLLPPLPFPFPPGAAWILARAPWALACDITANGARTSVRTAAMTTLHARRRWMVTLPPVC